MAIPATPTNMYVQQGNGQVLVSWDLTATALTYPVERSIDGVTYATVSNAAPIQFLDTAVVVGTQYYYRVSATNGSGTSSPTVAQTIVPTIKGDMTLGQLRLAAQQRADRVNSNFVTLPEWNSYITQSAFELYDLLVSAYGDEYFATNTTFVTTGLTGTYPLPADFYKTTGVDLGLASSTNAWVTLKQFNFIDRNNYAYPQVTASYVAGYLPRYRIVGNNIIFENIPSAGQTVRIWYVPRMTQPLLDTDMIDGISGWTEYVLCDAAIKALQKEEADVTVLAMQKQALLTRIETMSQNRDIGAPQTISNTRGVTDGWGAYGDRNYWGS